MKNYLAEKIRLLRSVLIKNKSSISEFGSIFIICLVIIAAIFLIIPFIIMASGILLVLFCAAFVVSLIVSVLVNVIDYLNKQGH